MKSQKGSKFEREISKKLSLWWSAGQRDDIFWRSQSSGARATIRKRKGKTTANQDGDLTAMHPDGQPLIDLVSIELKCGYPAFTLEGVINRPRLQKDLLSKFIEQCEKEIAGSKRYWWLIVRQNNRAEIVIFRRNFKHWLAKRDIILCGDRMEIQFSHKYIIIMRLADFLDSLFKSSFRQKVEDEESNVDNN